MLGSLADLYYSYMTGEIALMLNAFPDSARAIHVQCLYICDGNWKLSVLYSTCYWPQLLQWCCCYQ